jgi:hypothetical protein
MHYPPETSTIMLLVRILATFIQRTDREELKSQLMSLCHHTVNEEETIAHKLLGQEFESQLELLRDLSIKALGMPETSEVSYYLHFPPIFSGKFLHYLFPFSF